MPPLDWPVGAATGVGSLPGADVTEAVRLVLGELPDLPHLPELPQRGAGADLLGRGAALLTDLHVDLQPSGWRFVSHPGADERRGLDWLARDLDALEEQAVGVTGLLKLQAPGPWTLAAGIELTRGDRALADRAAVRDIAASLAHGLAEHVADVRRRVPGIAVVVQLDEPTLPAVLLGRVRTASGFGAISSVPEPDAEAVLRDVLAGCGAPAGVHTCAAAPPLALLGRAGAQFVSVDLTLLDERHDDDLGTLLESGVQLLAGVVPSVEPPARSPEDDTVRAAAAPLRALWRRLSFPAGRLAEQVTVTPTCGLAGASPAWARAAMTRAREVARSLAEAPEEG